MKRSAAEIVREYGPFPGVDHVHGVTFDGQHVWFAAGDKPNAFDPGSGKTLRSIDVAAHAGTAFDGQHLFRIPAPGGGGDSGLAWAEGTLWVGQHRGRKIHQIDPQTGAILRTIECNRVVTGVTWIDRELWHGTWEGDESDLRRLDPRTGEALERLEMPPGVGVSGLESDGGDRFFCGGGSSGGRFRGVRHSAGWDASDTIGNSRPDMRPHLYRQPEFRAGLARLAARGLSFDAWLYHPQLADVAGLARAVPAATIIMGHVGGVLGYGPYAGKADEVFAAWKSAMTELAACPNVVVKLGGMMRRLAAFD
jgi:Amidohydrolase